MAILSERILPPYLLDIRDSLAKRWSLYFTLGIALVILGIISISAAVFTTLISVIFVGSLLLVGGIAYFVHATEFWHKNWRDYFVHLLMGILYAAAGILMLVNPAIGAASLTLALSIFYLFQGTSRIILALTQPLPGWSWMLTNGIISLILGGLIWLYWPAVSSWVIGLFVGIDIMFIGWWLIMLGWTVHHISNDIQEKKV